MINNFLRWLCADSKVTTKIWQVPCIIMMILAWPVYTIGVAFSGKSFYIALNCTVIALSMAFLSILSMLNWECENLGRNKILKKKIF